MAELAIRQVAEQTGIAAGTIRMWEQRYGFPDPDRTASGYRRYSDEDVEALRRVASFRRLGLSIPAAIERVRGEEVVERPSIYAAVAAVDEMARPQLLRKRTLIGLSRAIEHETLASASSPLLFGAFQHEQAYRQVEHRWKRLARQADAATVFADFSGSSSSRNGSAGPVELPIDLDDAIGNEWAVIVDAPGYAACLLAWEHPSRIEAMGPDDERRTFEAIWTVHPRAVRRAAEVASRLAGQIDPTHGEALEGLLSERALAMESPAPALTALTNRAIAYLDQR
jgi:MerR family transcriptional regulator, light-induced transcriptional regulator